MRLATVVLGYLLGGVGDRATASFFAKAGGPVRASTFLRESCLVLKDEGGKSLLPVNLRDPRERNEIEMDRGYNFDEEKLTSNLT